MVAPFAFRQRPTMLQSKVSRLFDQIVSETDLTKYLIEHDISIPLLIVKVAENKISFFDLESYLHYILRILISNPSSVLYRQIVQCREIHSTGRHDFQGSLLLEFLFKDIAVAQKWSVWKPVGEYVLSYLGEQKGGMMDINNLGVNYDDIKGDKFLSPLFTGIEYFEFIPRERKP